MSKEDTSILCVLRRQLDPSYRMISDLIEACPEALWTSNLSGKPFWQQIMHVLIGIQFWFREAEEEFTVPDLGQGPIPDLDIIATFSLTKGQVKEYQELMAKRIAEFFSNMDDKRLMTASSIYDKYTYADIVIGQIRHFQHHVGYCNSVLHSNDVKPTKWLDSE